jgi:hypothetical protein
MLDTDGFPADVLRLLVTACAERGLRANNVDERAVCGAAFPCERASLADLALGAFAR